MTAIRISELAECTGVPATTLRYYETVGLLRPDRDANGYRRYRSDDIDRMRLVAGAKRLGLQLDEIAELVALRGDGACPPVRERLQSLLADRLDETRRSIAVLGELEAELSPLQRALASVDVPARCGEGCGCPDHPLTDTPAPALACALSGDEIADRISEWQSVAATATSRRRRDDGWQLRFADDPQLAGRIATLAAAEQRCCPFLAFRLELRDGALDLEITAPPEGGPLLASLFGTPPER